MINKVLGLVTVGILLFSCSAEKQKANNRKQQSAKIDFNAGNSPAEFSVKTTEGKIFASKAYRGKYLVVLFYNKSFFKQQRNNGFTVSLNKMAKKLKGKVGFVGIMNGFVENEKEGGEIFRNNVFSFPQVNNTLSYDQDAQLNDNVFCTPAAIVIDPKGEVVYHQCGDSEMPGILHQLNAMLKEKL